MKNHLFLLLGIGILIAGVSGCASLGYMDAVRPLPGPDEVPTLSAFVHPLPGSRIISPFGQRGWRMHDGVDLRKNDKGGDAVLAAGAGIVEMARRCSGYGLTVMIVHSDGFRTRYAHLKKIMVTENQRVDACEQIGIVGSTGNATGPHLHFEILTSLNHSVDPFPYLQFIVQSDQSDKTEAQTVRK